MLLKNMRPVHRIYGGDSSTPIPASIASKIGVVIKDTNDGSRLFKRMRAITGVPKPKSAVASPLQQDTTVATAELSPTGKGPLEDDYHDLTVADILVKTVNNVLTVMRSLIDSESIIKIHLGSEKSRNLST